MECYLLNYSKYIIAQKHSVTASNRYVFRYRKLAKEIITLIDCFCLKTKQLIQFSNIEAFSCSRTKGFFILDCINYCFFIQLAEKYCSTKQPNNSVNELSDCFVIQE